MTNYKIEDIFSWGDKMNDIELMKQVLEAERVSHKIKMKLEIMKALHSFALEFELSIIRPYETSIKMSEISEKLKTQLSETLSKIE